MKLNQIDFLIVSIFIVGLLYYLKRPVDMLFIILYFKSMLFNRNLIVVNILTLMITTIIVLMIRKKYEDKIPFVSLLTPYIILFS